MNTIKNVGKSVKDNIKLVAVTAAIAFTSVSLYFVFRKKNKRFLVALSERVDLTDIKAKSRDYKLINFTTPELTNPRHVSVPLRGFFNPGNAPHFASLRRKVDLLVLSQETNSTQVDIDPFFGHTIAQKNNVLSVSLSQIAGQGRGNHSWSSSGRNVFMTLGLSILDQEYAGLAISLAMALAISGVIARLVPGKRVNIKWPNDVLVEGTKVCGILTQSCENLLESSLLNFTVGVGINLEQNGRFPGLAEVAGLQYEDGLRELVICECVSEFFDLIGRFSSEELPDFLVDRINPILQQKGKVIQFTDGQSGKHEVLEILGLQREDFDIVGRNQAGDEFTVKPQNVSLSEEPVHAKLTLIRKSEQ